MFTDTAWDTAADKAKYLEWMRRFALRGMPLSMFPNTKYRRLSMMFGHIAHYNRDGFYDEWFSTPDRRRDWIRHVLKYEPYNSDAHYTWVDVEIAFRDWLLANVSRVTAGIDLEGRHAAA